MKYIRLVLVLCALALLGGAIGYTVSLFMQKDANEAVVAENVESVDGETSYSMADVVRSFPVPTKYENAELQIDYPNGTVAGELVVQFTSRADYLAYLKALAGADFLPLGQIDELLAVRIDANSVLTVNPGLYAAIPDFSFEVMRPLPPVEISPEALASLQGFGQTARQIVGGLIDGDGTGVIVAVLDSGIQAHAQFDDVYIVKIDLVGEGSATTSAAHGTSVASIIAGSEGIAPHAELLVVRVLNDEGLGNSYHVAEGIVQATDMGVKVINMSIAVYQDSALLRSAVQYAHQKGVIMVAAAGNDGYTRMPFPAAYEEVISVTAIDAIQRQALFPNQSTKIDIAAPGVAILTAKEEQGTILFTGTSAAAPFVSGTLAAMLSADNALPPTQTVALVKRYLNDAGSAGEDSAYGDGIIDWNRLRERDTRGILDLALADIHLDREALPGTTMPIEVTVQNRGTQWSPESTLEVILGDADPIEFSVAALGPGATTTRKVFSQVPIGADAAPLAIQATVLPEKINADVRLENNIKGVFFRAK
jgi:subtilisin family serine protease